MVNFNFGDIDNMAEAEQYRKILQFTKCEVVSNTQLIKNHCI